jgi:ferrous iron transport protein B
MAARTIPNRKERLLTIFIIPLISCSARIPVYALLIGFLVPQENSLLSGFILTVIYLVSITLSLTVAGIINRFRPKVLQADDNSTFILELPTYRIPQFRVVLSNMWTSTKVYVRGAGPIILTFSVILWLLTYFPNYNPKVNAENVTPEKKEQLAKIERIETSYAADIGKILEPIMKPMGLDWRVGVAILTSFAAREVFVSSMALMFKITDADENSIQRSIIGAMRNAKDKEGKPMFTTSSIIGLILFFIIALQCVSTLAITKKETGGWKIPAIQLLLYSGGAYILSVITVHVLRLFGVA